MLDRVVGLLVHQYLLGRAGFVAESAEKATISSYVDPDGTRCCTSRLVRSTVKARERGCEPPISGHEGRDSEQPLRAST